MPGTRTPSRRATQAAHPHGARAFSGRLVAFVASLLTVLVLLGAAGALLTSGTESDLYWVLSGLIALMAVAVWLCAVVFLRPSGRLVSALIPVLAVLIATGIYGGVRDGEEGIPLVLASVVMLFGCVATLLWNQSGFRRR